MAVKVGRCFCKKAPSGSFHSQEDQPCHILRELCHAPEALSPGEAQMSEGQARDANGSVENKGHQSLVGCSFVPGILPSTEEVGVWDLVFGGWCLGSIELSSLVLEFGPVWWV